MLRPLPKAVKKGRPAFGGNMLTFCMNIIVSGWPAAGSTTLSLLLAYSLQYKYLYGGELLKFLTTKLYGDISGDKILAFEDKYGNYFDRIWDDYALWKLNNEDRLLLEGKATGFFADSESIYEIMVVASPEVRIARVNRDKRLYSADTLQKRDAELQSRWTAAYGLDIFDPLLIQDNFDLIIDNSLLSIAEEVDTVLQNLEEDYRFPKDDLSGVRKRVKGLENQFWKDGKDYFLNALAEQKLLVTRAEVFRDWGRHFSEQLAGWPIELKHIVDTESQAQ